MNSPNICPNREGRPVGSGAAEVLTGGSNSTQSTAASVELSVDVLIEALIRGRIGIERTPEWFAVLFHYGVYVGECRRQDEIDELRRELEQASRAADVYYELAYVNVADLGRAFEAVKRNRLRRLEETEKQRRKRLDDAAEDYWQQFLARAGGPQ